MMGGYTLLFSFKRKEGGQLTFGDNSKGNIFGYGIVSNITSSYIENVQLVDNLKHNLLSISQLYDKGYRIIFDSSSCKIEDTTSNRVILMGSRNDNVYTIDIEHDHYVEK